MSNPDHFRMSYLANVRSRWVISPGSVIAIRSDPYCVCSAIRTLAETAFEFSIAASISEKSFSFSYVAKVVRPDVIGNFAEFNKTGSFGKYSTELQRRVGSLSTSTIIRFVPTTGRLNRDQSEWSYAYYRPIGQTGTVPNWPMQLHVSPIWPNL